MLSLINNLLFPSHVPSELIREIFDEFCFIFDFAEDSTDIFHEHRKHIMGTARAYKNRYEMTINWNYGMHNALVAMAHEFIHFDQFKTKRLQLQYHIDGISFSRYYFEGTVYDVNLIPYNDRPWEKEAYKLEDLMLQTFIEGCNYQLYHKICKHLHFPEKLKFGKVRKKVA